MPTHQTRNASRTAELNAFIHTQGASSQCQNGSAVVRASLLQWQAQRNERKRTAMSADRARG